MSRMISLRHTQWRKKACILLACAFFSACLHAQTLNLNNAIQRALQNYPDIQQRRAELNAGRSHITTVKDHRLPAITVTEQINAGTANSMIGPYFSMGIVPSTSGAIAANNKSDLASGNIAAALVQWDVYRFGYYNAEKKEAEAAYAASDARLSAQQFLLTNSVVNLYFDWLKKYRLLLVQQQNMERANTIFTSIKANVISGLKPGVDSSTAKAESSHAYINYLQALTAYESDRIELASYIAADTTGLQPDTSLLSDARLQRIAGIIPADQVPLSQPLLNSYEQEYQQQLLAGKVIAKKYLPKLSFQGAAWTRGSSITYSDTYSQLSDGLSYARYNYLFGLALSYNITDIRQRHDLLAEERYKAEAKKAAVQSEQLNLTSMLQKSATSYTGIMQQLREFPVLLQSARMAYTRQLTLYNAGLNILTDVTNALYALRQAEADYVITQDELFQVQYLRAGLTGQQDSFLEILK